MYEDESVWSRKGALLTDFLARTEFGLSQPEIYAAVHAGKLQCQIGQDQYGPHLQLLRHEVEALVAEKRQRGSPPPNTQLLELALGELDETLVNIIAFLCLDSPRAFGGSIHDILEAYHHMLAWIARPLDEDRCQRECDVARGCPDDDATYKTGGYHAQLCQAVAVGGFRRCLSSS